LAHRPYSRADRLAKSIQEVVSDALQYEASDQRLHQVVITRVVVSPDLQTGKVYWHLLQPGDESEIRDIEKALDRARGWLKRQVASQIQIRKIPDIQIYYDRGLQHARRMEAIFEDLPRRSDEDQGE
jgi:ribosome-binding factor A